MCEKRRLARLPASHGIVDNFVAECCSQSGDELSHLRHRVTNWFASPASMARYSEGCQFDYGELSP